MVGFQDSINLVKETLSQTEYGRAADAQSPVDHDRILRDYDNLMREHERKMGSHRRHIRHYRNGNNDDDDKTRSRSPRASMRFRFKSGGKSNDKSSSNSGGGRKRKHRSRDSAVQDEMQEVEQAGAGDRDGHRDGHRDRVTSSSSRRRTRARTQSPLPDTEGANVDMYPEAHVSSYAAHPLPRPKESEYLDPTVDASGSPPSPPLPHPQQRTHTSTPAPTPTPDTVFEGPDDAFRASLFDAIADDEGAAYWQGVYGEPIHIYGRPSVRTKIGELEQMNDDQYAEYVKQKMWEKKNPELAKEREERARQQLDDDEAAKTRRGRHDRHGDDDQGSGSDYEWVGNEEKGYERRRVKHKSRHRPTTKSERGRGFMSDVDDALARGAARKEAKKWQQAWAAYQAAWTQLKESKTVLSGQPLADAIPWPVLSRLWTHVGRDNIQDFFRKYNLGEGETRTGLLKAERFRWHPDKIQHRFGGDNVDADTLKLVTSVFQTIDEMMADEKRKGPT